LLPKPDLLERKPGLAKSKLALVEINLDPAEGLAGHLAGSPVRGKSLVLLNWDAGIRTPISRSRVL
jgi:hypothetical protein